jgi:hypothetical protein
MLAPGRTGHHGPVPQLLRNHLLPSFGEVPIDAITRQAVKVYITDLRSRYSQHTVASIVGLLGLILREA